MHTYHRFGDSNVFKMLEILPFSIVIGIPLLMFGTLLYYLLKDNGKWACLFSSSIYFGGMVCMFSTLLMPLSTGFFIYTVCLTIIGAIIGFYIYKDLKSKGYL